MLKYFTSVLLDGMLYEQLLSKWKRRNWLLRLIIILFFVHSGIARKAGTVMKMKRVKNSRVDVLPLINFISHFWFSLGHQAHVCCACAWDHPQRSQRWEFESWFLYFFILFLFSPYTCYHQCDEVNGAEEIIFGYGAERETIPSFGLGDCWTNRDPKGGGN